MSGPGDDMDSQLYEGAGIIFSILALSPMSYQLLSDHLWVHYGAVRWG